MLLCHHPGRRQGMRANPDVTWISKTASSTAENGVWYPVNQIAILILISEHKSVLMITMRKD
jgi:hypothetical protein